MVTKKKLFWSLILAQSWFQKFHEKMAKNLVSGPILALFGPNISHQVFFKILTLPVTKYYGQLSSSTLSEKYIDPILRKLSDGQTDRRTNRRTRVIS